MKILKMFYIKTTFSTSPLRSIFVHKKQKQQKKKHGNQTKISQSRNSKREEGVEFTCDILKVIK
jgi:hypothetical protein